jgi:TolA-binding protein
MNRPRFTVTRIALAGAGLLTAAGIGASVIPQAISSAPTAAAATTAPAPAATSPAPATTPKAGQKKGAKARLRQLGLAVHRLLVTQTATQTGMTVKQVRTELRSGKSLATIAGTKAPAVEAAALAAITSKLDAARAAGKITQAQETSLEARAQKVIARMMARTPHPRAPKATPAA